MRHAPGSPSTPDLHAAYPLDLDTAKLVSETRLAISEFVSGRRAGLVAIIGPCALTDVGDTVRAESQAAAELEQQYAPGLVVARRLPVWKPRTDPKEWHGLETTDPERAYALLAQQAKNYGNVALEYDHMPHAQRYGPLTALAWYGARNGQATDKMAMAKRDPTLPIGVKNGLDGSIDAALNEIEAINSSRGPDAAPAVLIYRGGANAKDPETWATHYKEAIERTNGLLIVDTAHGSEMAHDPKGKFAKSVDGQIASINHVISLAGEGYTPAGIMIEATDAISPTDPTIPFQIALGGIKRLADLRAA